ncbi:unnamed protein product [Caenorhabditis nigoni]
MLINVITSSGPLNLMPIIIIALLIIATINGSLSYNCLLVTQLICPLSSHFKRYRHIRIFLHLHRSLYSFERCLGGSNTPQGDILFTIRTGYKQRQQVFKTMRSGPRKQETQQQRFCMKWQ